MSTGRVSHRLYRILPITLQNFIVTSKGRKRWVHETSEHFRKLVCELMEMQFDTPESIRKHQEKKLRSVLLAAKATDYYSGILPSESSLMNEDPFSILSSVPVLTKDAVRLEYRAFINPDFEGKLIRHGTSGTTGTPLQTVWTDACIDMERALIWRQRRQTGLNFGSVWRGMLGGHQIVPLTTQKPPFWRISKASKQLYFSTYHISPDNAPFYHAAMKKFDVRAIEGYPSVLFALAHSLNQRGLKYDLDGIYYGAEPLLDFQRELIENTFNCYVWDYYGLTERNASASEFECRNGLHENWENCVLEIVDADGLTVPEGMTGELVGTSLSNFGFPILRYRTGDMTSFLSGECACNRHSRRIARIDTKREDLLLMPDGSLLSASNLTYPFKEVDNILESQLVQDVVTELKVRIIPATEYSSENGERLLSGLKEYLPETVKLKLEIVSEIPRTKAGKFRFCVSNLTSAPRK